MGVGWQKCRIRRPVSVPVKGDGPLTAVIIVKMEKGKQVPAILKS